MERIKLSTMKILMTKLATQISFENVTGRILIISGTLNKRIATRTKSVIINWRKILFATFFSNGNFLSRAISMARTLNPKKVRKKSPIKLVPICHKKLCSEKNKIFTMVAIENIPRMIKTAIFFSSLIFKAPPNLPKVEALVLSYWIWLLIKYCGWL